VDDGGSSRGSHNGDQARLDRVEEQLAELRAEVAQLKRILSRSGGEPESERGGDLLNSGPATARAGVRAGLSMRSAQAEVVLTVFVSGHSRYRIQYGVSWSPVDAFAETRVNPAVVVHAPPELRDWARTRPAPLREHAESLLEGVKERLTDTAAGQVVNAVWEPATTGWQVTGFWGFDSAAGVTDDLDNWSHREAGNWAAQLGGAAGLPGGIADGAGAVIRYLVPLPVDRPLEDLSRVIKVAGIVVFALAGGHVLACASLKSLVHQELTDLLARQLRTVISSQPAGPEPGWPPGRRPLRPPRMSIEESLAQRRPHQRMRPGQPRHATGPTRRPGTQPGNPPPGRTPGSRQALRPEGPDGPRQATRRPKTVRGRPPGRTRSC
jgi:hypothetical protein